VIGVFIDNTGLDFSMKGRQTCIIKWDTTTDQDIKHHAKAPYVDFRAGIMSSLEQFRGSKVERATECREKF
jgi:hypothetical protein